MSTKQAFLQSVHPRQKAPPMRQEATVTARMLLESPDVTVVSQDCALFLED